MQSCPLFVCCLCNRAICVDVYTPLVVANYSRLSPAPVVIVVSVWTLPGLIRSIIGPAIWSSAFGQLLLLCCLLPPLVYVCLSSIAMVTVSVKKLNGSQSCILSLYENMNDIKTEMDVFHYLSSFYGIYLTCTPFV